MRPVGAERPGRFPRLRRGRALAGAVSLLGFAGCAGPAVVALRAASDTISRGGSGAKAQADAALRTAKSRDDRAAAYYLRALARLQQGDRAGSRGDLRSARTLKPTPALAARIDVLEGNMDFDEGMYASAALRYAQCAENLPARSRRDRILFQYGTALQRCNRFRDGAEVFRTLISKSPDSPYAPLAARKVDWNLNYFTVQCGAFLDPGLAREAAGSLASRGHPARVVEAPRSAPLRWVVHCGRFAGYAEASRAQANLRPLCADAFILP